MDRNPVSDIRRKKAPRGRTRFLSDEERAALLEACARSEWAPLHALALLAITTGARRGELLSLRWVDVDLRAGRATLHETKNGEQRTLPLPGKALESLGFRDALRPAPPIGDPAIGVPDVIAGQMDMLPAKRREVRQQLVVDRALRPQALDGSREVGAPPRITRRALRWEKPANAPRSIHCRARVDAAAVPGVCPRSSGRGRRHTRGALPKGYPVRADRRSAIHQIRNTQKKTPAWPSQHVPHSGTFLPTAPFPRCGSASSGSGCSSALPSISPASSIRNRQRPD